MRFKLGEHVKAFKLGWYGQVIEFSDPDYRVRVGGMSVVRTIAEADLEPIIPDRRVVPHAFPPVDIVKDGGSLKIPNLAYPFSNEKGLTNDKFWLDLQSSNIDHGAFVGVSGSILDFAKNQWGKCQQIISTDINTETVKAIDDLRTVIALVNSTTSITRTKYHWTAKNVISVTQVTKSELLSDVIDAYRTEEARTALQRYSYVPSSKGELLSSALRRMEANCYGKLNFSNWYKNEIFVAGLGNLMSLGRFNIICGDLQNFASQRVLNDTLKYPVSLFNFSNALDYISRPDLIVNLFKRLRHSMNAKVITSSQVAGLEDQLGTFKEAKIHKWDDFIAILELAELQVYFGTLLDKASDVS